MSTEVFCILKKTLIVSVTYTGLNQSKFHDGGRFRVDWVYDGFVTISLRFQLMVLPGTMVHL